MAKTKPFDLFTERYELWFEKHRFTYLSEVNALKKVFPRKGLFVEVGAGTGRFSKPLGIRYGVEPSLEMGKVALKRGIRIVRGIAENLPLKSSIFDAVLFVTTICFVDDIEKSFKEANRILKETGSIFLGFIDKDSPLGRFYLEHKEQNPFYKEATFFSTKEVLEHLNKAGFKVEKILQTIFHLLPEVKEIESVKEGFGEGSFVVIKAKKAH